MNDNIKEILEETNYFAEEEYERRREARLARIEAEKKRQLLYRRLFLAGIGVILVVVLVIVGVNVIRHNIKKNRDIKPDDTVTEADMNNQTGDDTNETPADIDPNVTVDDNIVYNSYGKARQFELVASDYDYSDTYAVAITYPELYSQYGMVINVTDGKVVASIQGNAKMYPASMTKVMTVLTAMQYISEEELDELVEITQEASDYAYSNGCAAVNYGVGAKVPVRDLFYGTILKSGADAAYMLAVYTAGSHQAFVELMNENCVALGIADTTHFSNCVGIYTDDNYSTCHDMAVIMNAAEKNVFLSEVLNTRQYVTVPTDNYPEGVKISNLFLRRIEDYDTMGVVCAAKTGFVNQSGNCAVSYMLGIDGKEYICVTGHGNSAWQEIYDHIALYNIYAMNNTGYDGPVKMTN